MGSEISSDFTSQSESRINIEHWLHQDEKEEKELILVDSDSGESEYESCEEVTDESEDENENEEQPYFAPFSSNSQKHKNTNEIEWPRCSKRRC